MCAGDQVNDLTMADWARAVDIDEKDDADLIRAEMPGIK